MKDTPEIAPELRGLLEEIVADPRSSMRLAPRRALRSWFMSGERIRPREVATTRAERHLLEAHREALAELLYEAAKIAYWKTPRLAVRPLGKDGRPYDATRAEDSIRPRIRSRIRRSTEGDAVSLLRGCLAGVTAHAGYELASASLGLAPRDNTRFLVARMASSNHWSDTPLALTGLSERTRDMRLKVLAMVAAGASLAQSRRIVEAREAYLRSTRLDPAYPVGWVCALNLACFLGLEREAAWCAHQVSDLAQEQEHRVVESTRIVREWGREMSSSIRRTARATAARIIGETPTGAISVLRSVGS